jgi:glycosyltransferase involved in cell wall biosynthesis
MAQQTKPQYTPEELAKIEKQKEENKKLVFDFVGGVNPSTDADKILYFIADNAGCGWYRARQPAKYINKNHNADLNLFITNYMRAGEWVNDPKLRDSKYKLFVHQRQHQDPNYEHMQLIKKELKVPQVYEIDDDLFNVSIYSSAYVYYNNQTEKKKLDNLAKYMQNIDYITTTTEPLADRLKKYNSRVTVIPNAIDLPMFNPYLKTDKDYDKKEIVIGWTGSNTHYADLLEAEDAIAQVVNKYPNVKLLIGGWDKCPLFKNVPDNKKITVPWTTMEKYPEMLSKIDIGVCPLEETKFNEAKSNLKYIELAAMGIPVIASKVYPYEHTITDGQDGFLIKAKGANHIKWVKKLETLINDREVRKQIGTNGRKLIEEKYNQERVSDDWYRFYKSII